MPRYYTLIDMASRLSVKKTCVRGDTDWVAYYGEGYDCEGDKAMSVHCTNGLYVIEVDGDSLILDETELSNLSGLLNLIKTEEAVDENKS